MESPQRRSIEFHDPIFIFSAGPRSGSTLLQRFLTSGHEVLIWGENQGGLNHLMQSLHLFGVSLAPAAKSGANGALHYQKFIESGCDPGQWIANINPPMQHIAASYRRLFDNLYGVPALTHGYSRWGIKEVRCSETTVRTLHALFPDAKILFLVRNPFDCLRSIKQRRFKFFGNDGERVLSDPIEYFAQNWAELALTYRRMNDIGYHIRYEDIVAPDYSIANLCEYLRISRLDPRFISTSWADWEAMAPDEQLTKDEIARAMSFLGDEHRHYGYDQELG